jgi:hypothetical protein
MSVVVEGGAVSAAAVGLARMRPRRGRVRREPIDVELIAAEFAEPKKRPEHEIIAALEAEVRRAKQARAAAALPAPAAPVPVAPRATPAAPAIEAAAPEANLTAPRQHVITAQQLADPNGPEFPLDQVRAWLEQVKDDLRKVQARVEFLQFEQDRLQGQQHLVTELFSATTPA